MLGSIIYRWILLIDYSIDWLIIWLIALSRFEADYAHYPQPEEYLADLTTQYLADPNGYNLAAPKGYVLTTQYLADPTKSVTI